MTPSEIQKAAVARRWAAEEARFPIPAGVGPHECHLHPGFYYVPWIDSRLVFSRDGRVIKLLTGLPHKTSFNHKGYRVVSFRRDGKWTSMVLHRVLAMLFCPVPERHAGVSFDELEVNHKDGDKLNNHVDNLEWVTTGENMAHAWESGLVKTESPVVVRNVTTGEEIRYRSLSSCARAFCIGTGPMALHLNSPYAGMILNDGHQFKFDDGSQWPEITAVEMPGIRIGMNCDCVGENVDTGTKLVFSSLVTAARYLELPLNSLRLSRSRNGPEVPYKGWIFYSLSGRPLSKKLK